MKRRWKVFWIICMSLTGLGMMLCIAALGLGVTRESLMENMVLYIEDDGYYTHAPTDDFHTSTGSSVREFTGINELDIDVHGGQIEIIEGDLETGEIRVESGGWNRGVRLKMEEEEKGTLSIETKKFISGRRNHMFGNIYITIPAGMKFREVSISIGAGDLNIDHILADSIGIETGAGEIDIQKFTAQEVDAQCGAGSIYMEGEATREIDLQCDVGSVEYAAPGTFEDYNYDLECNIGEIVLDGRSYSGLAKEKKIDQGQMKEMNIECKIGSVTVNFMEE